ncbi:hypothetical protein D3C80_1738610 [compost metagenome]
MSFKRPHLIVQSLDPITHFTHLRNELIRIFPILLTLGYLCRNYIAAVLQLFAFLKKFTALLIQLREA